MINVQITMSEEEAKASERIAGVFTLRTSSGTPFITGRFTDLKALEEFIHDVRIAVNNLPLSQRKA